MLSTGLQSLLGLVSNPHAMLSRRKQVCASCLEVSNSASEFTVNMCCTALSYIAQALCTSHAEQDSMAYAKCNNFTNVNIAGDQ